MRRTLLLGLLVGSLATAAIVVLWPSPIPAGALQKEDNIKVGNGKEPESKLPVARVVLFSSGVGYFERDGEIDGNARVDLSFPVSDVNDLLKSMVLQDFGGGQVSAVSYDSHDPIAKTLRSFAIDLTDNPGMGDVLNRARGEKIEVTMQPAMGIPPITGTLVGVEKQKVPVKDHGVVEVEYLNVLAADGLRSIKLSEVQRVRFLNPTIDNELKRALEILSLSHDTQKKTVSLNFTGQGKRRVNVGYVVENPIWKTSYRLVVKKDGNLFLQGWAVVENTSDEDWNKVDMVLVSGRPISFEMDLYQPLYVPRPKVEPELFASLRPQTYEGGMESDRKPAQAPPPARPGTAGGVGGGGGGYPGAPSGGPGGPGMPGGGGPGHVGDARKATESKSVERLGRRAGREEMQLDKGIASAATATEVGDFFQYDIEQPVTLARQKSAMLPIVNQPVKGKKVSIYNQATHAKYPLLGLQFENTTGLHLMQGPITVFEGNSYAGDARIMDLQPKEKRLLSYAMDLGTEVDPDAKSEPDRIMSLKIVKGTLQVSTKNRQAKTYNVKNRSTHDRQVVIEHPVRQDFTLISPKEPTERTRDSYRFEFPVKPGEVAKQEVVEERVLTQAFALTNLDDQTIRFYFTNPVASAKLKEALQKAIDLRVKLAAVQRDANEVNRQLQEITQDQTRLRANIKELPPTAAAYKRYVEKFDNQETEIEKLQTQLKKLRDDEAQQRKAYEAFLLSLDVE